MQIRTDGNQAASKRNAALARLEAIAESIAASAGLEVVDVEWKGTGRNQLLRISIDKPEGVTHSDCELVSHKVSAILDAEDPVSGAYQLEVSSPGVERKLKKWTDWKRFTGKKAKVVLKEPVNDLKYFDGTIARVDEAEGTGAEGTEHASATQQITVEMSGGRLITFSFSQIERANLKFEW